MHQEVPGGHELSDFNCQISCWTAPCMFHPSSRPILIRAAHTCNNPELSMLSPGVSQPHIPAPIPEHSSHPLHALPYCLHALQPTNVCLTLVRIRSRKPDHSGASFFKELNLTNIPQQHQKL